MIPVAITTPILQIWIGLSILALLYCAWVDYRSFRIPNKVTYPFLLGSLALTLIAGEWPTALLGGLLAGGILLLPRIIAGPEKAGMGDVKFAALGGLLLGPELAIYALSIAFVGALIINAPAIIRKRVKISQPLPFGPYLAAGFIPLLIVSQLVS